MVEYDSKTALIVVDVQNDFADPKGNLYVRGGEEVIGTINDEIARAKDAGALVVYTRDWHPEETPHFQEFGGTWPVHCVAETWGSEFHPDLRVDGPVVHKAMGPEDGYSGFSVRHERTGERSSTELEGILRDRGIERVVVVGLATDYCVKETAVDAARLGFEVVVLRDAMRAVELKDGDADRALEAMNEAGARVE
jgi:nicotinamidase/pyrazinamidase